MYIQRKIENEVKDLFSQYPVITLTGPRQSGKTTLLRNIFPGVKYSSLEDPNERSFAQNDPVRFLAQANEGMIIDEVQRVPELVSYIQGIVDETNKPGMFILSGSQQFELTRSISQSLAERTAILRLLPFSIDEAYDQKEKTETDTMMLRGFFPRVFAQNLDPAKFYANLVETYVRRDLSELITVRDIHLFQKFLSLCAGRIGQVLVASSLANEVGVSVKTIQSWISILEASYILYLLHPYHSNIGKRFIKSPKIYFYDTGLAAYLLGIQQVSQLSVSPYRGNLFENMVVMEMKKFMANRGKLDSLCFYHDSHHNEVDILTDTVFDFNAIEIKSAKTFNNDMFKGLNYMRDLLPEKTKETILCYDGMIESEYQSHRLVNFRNISNFLGSLKSM